MSYNDDDDDYGDNYRQGWDDEVSIVEVSLSVPRLQYLTPPQQGAIDGSTYDDRYNDDNGDDPGEDDQGYSGFQDGQDDVQNQDLGQESEQSFNVQDEPAEATDLGTRYVAGDDDPDGETYGSQRERDDDAYGDTVPTVHLNLDMSGYATEQDGDSPSDTRGMQRDSYSSRPGAVVQGGQVSSQRDTRSPSG